MGQVMIGRDPTSGRPIRPTVYGATRKEVVDKLDQIREDHRKGVLQASEMALSDFLDNWLVSVKHKSGEVRQLRYGQQLAHVRPYLGKVPLRDLSAWSVTRMVEKMQEDGLSSSVQKHAVLRLRQALTRAVSLDLLPKNPAVREKVPTPKHESREMKPLRPEEIGRLLEATRDHRLWALLVVALDTGARQGELLALEWSDWIPASRELSITKSLRSHRGRLEVKEPKTKGSRRRVMVSQQTARVLEAHRALMEAEGHRGRLIFCNRQGRHLRATNFGTDYWLPWLKLAGLEGVRFHDLRHTCATLLLLARVNIKVVSERLGHASPTITLTTYSHVIPGMQEQAAEVMGEVLDCSRNAVTRGTDVQDTDSKMKQDQGLGDWALDL
jgi:integrase